MPDTALIIMARYPEPGKTKTRLARFIGNDEAVLLYTAFLTDLAHRFAGCDYDLYWTYTPPEVDYSSFITTLVSASAPFIRCFPQQGDDLGQRLHYAFQWTHAHGYKRTIVIGSDSPHISPCIVTHAQAALENADIVLGPADDGGYYLIAMREPHDVFSGIPMSTNVVTQQTIDLAHHQGLTVQLLEPLFDIDELPDLLRLMQLLATDCSLAPATAAQLERLRSLHDHHTHYSYPATLNLHRAD
ncbi:MAG TPA: TIGR04282 family arsenosugar biosynthesis glycosyltransferase [Ktedonobacteraceae bacterium]|nr:TIGR04282 family arsenosugar biosynthesis glycosyltransferase [Ktedonobacteraceae bacterium]